ncbi:unnamed protein product [Alopecurus aequalis]
MAIKDARKVESKKRTHANASSSVAMAPAEMPHRGANHVQPPPPLPPGVYFSPTPEECLSFLNRRIAGDTELHDARGHIHHANVYGETPDTLRQRHQPASIREREHTWWFMSETTFQSQAAGGGASKRSGRKVQTGGYWRLEQSKEKLDDDGFKNTFGYYVDGDSKSKKKYKTPWLMREFTSANDDGAGKRGVPALYRVYVTPRATDDQLQEIFGEDGVKHEPDGNKKPARIIVRVEYFNGVAALLPQGSVRGGVVAQEHVQAPPPLPPVAPEGHLDDFYSEHEHYFAQYQQQQDGYLGQYEQQQGPLSMVAPPLPPPASPGLLAELAAEDNLSMPMADIMSMLDGSQQPAETVKGEEPNWESLDDIVDGKELANFNKEG